MFLQKIIDLTPIKTYTIGLQQAKAYRVLKQITARALEQYNLSSLDWALLGLLVEKKAGLRPSEIAEMLGVEAPFVSVLVDQLQKKKLVSRKNDPVDRRAKLIILSATGRKQVTVIEKSLRQATRHLLAGVSPQDIMAYLKVLRTIVENAEK